MIRLLFDAKEVWNNSNHHISLVYYLLMMIWKWRQAGNKKRKKFWNKFNHFDIRFSISIYYNSIISGILFSDSDKPPYLSRHKARQWWNLWFEQIIITNICYGKLPNHCDVNRFAKSTFSFQFFFIHGQVSETFFL